MNYPFYSWVLLVACCFILISVIITIIAHLNEQRTVKGFKQNIAEIAYYVNAIGMILLAIGIFYVVEKFLHTR